MIHLLAAGTVKSLEQGGDDAFLNGQFGFKRSDFRGEFLDLLFRRFDGFS